jgi:hypothetical protein
LRLAFTLTPKTRAAFSPKICSFTERVSGSYRCFSTRLEDGIEAHNRGDYADAVRWWRQAAELGNAEV